jgi:hypothetical protein
MSASIDRNPVFHACYTRATVHISEDFDTRRKEISAHIGTAPDETTIIVYPYRDYATGYWNKTEARKMAAKLKADLRAWIKANGVKLSQPLEVSERFWS